MAVGGGKCAGARCLQVVSCTCKEDAVRLMGELRRAKRREEKLLALQFRLGEDMNKCGGDLRCARMQACMHAPDREAPPLGHAQEKALSRRPFVGVLLTPDKPAWKYGLLHASMRVMCEAL